MPLDPRQDLMLALAGTVRIPSPPPASGSVSVVADDDWAKHIPDLVLRVGHRVSSRLYLERIVRLADVRAIYAPWPQDDSSPKVVGGPSQSQAGGALPAASRVEEGGWEYKVGEDLVGALTRHIAAHGLQAVWLAAAVVFVPHEAPVVLQVEAALTAAESAEYYPPLVGDGSTRAARYLGKYTHESAGLGADSTHCDKDGY